MRRKLIRSVLAALLGLTVAMGAGWAVTQATPAQVADPSGSTGGNGG